MSLVVFKGVTIDSCFVHLHKLENLRPVDPTARKCLPTDFSMSEMIVFIQPKCDRSKHVKRTTVRDTCFNFRLVPQDPENRIFLTIFTETRYVLISKWIQIKKLIEMFRKTQKMIIRQTSS